MLCLIVLGVRVVDPSRYSDFDLLASGEAELVAAAIVNEFSDMVLCGLSSRTVVARSDAV